MKILKHHGNLSSVKRSLSGNEFAHSSQIGEEFSSLNKLHCDVDESAVLSHSFHLDYEGMVERVENKILVSQMVHLFGLHYVVFL